MNHHPQAKKRCGWVSDDPLYISYHDEEWGVPLFDEQRLFEFLILETFQAGLSWITVLRKRENFRAAFDHFDVKKVATYDDAKLESLMADAGIIRNGAKIRAAVSNAQAFIQIQKEFGSFSKYIWDFVDGKPMQNSLASLKDIPAKTELAEQISKALKKRGFKFVGPTVIYAHMQATGMVNDHTVDCFRHKEVQTL
ncbi:MAG: DNA-3-methyladenine glycosylase I [Flavobacteriales bacterium]|nr:DNA-3-methyladenine glycosylase I [Flavobacteriales bacterium]